MASSDDDDARVTELETLEAIFPEIRRPLDAPGFVFELELPVRPAEPVTVLFPAPDGSQPATAAAASSTALPSSSTSSGPPAPAAEPVDSLLISHLPPVSLRIVLPDGYPADKPPQVSISTAPQWLSRETLADLESDGPRLWEEAGRDLVAYSYIDHVHRAAEDVFGAITAEGTLAVPPEHKLAVLDYDIKAKRAAFEQGTFDCGICLDPKKGSKCHKMLECGHIFCLQCLQDFYNGTITEGNVSAVRCLTPNCAKQRTAAGPSAASRRKTFISPSELLQIGLTEEAVKRYVTLKYKTELESDKDTIYCPRQWCNGAARSKKHKKPEGLQFSDTADSDGDGTDGDDDQDATDEKAVEEERDRERDRKKAAAAKFSAADLLSVCEDCGFAFCSRCLQTWHGEFVYCVPKRNTDELTEEEKASLEYLQLHTSPCPTCAAPAQKTHGCNHMICSRCDTHFCYLCSSWLDPGNPYKHYNQQGDGKVTSCYMRLWELEGGDGNDVGIGFVGGRGAAAVAGGGGADPQPHHDAAMGDAVLLALLQDEPDESDTETEDGDDAPAVGRPAIAVAREAPLVLRLMDNNQQPRGGRRVAQPAPPQQPPHPAAARGRGGGRGHHQHHHHGPHRGAARGADHYPRAAGGGRGALPQRGGRGGGAVPRGGGRPARGAYAGGRVAAAAAAAGRGGGAAAAAAEQQQHRRHQQQHHNQHQQERRQRGPQQPLPAGGGNDNIVNNNDNNNNAGAGLDAAQEAWVRHFVQMALLDEEDQVEGGDSDSDDGNWHIR
ncbi:RBR-type E3 ubiquitin transferase [Purpureocillium takamizusanense]|uniref:RBR-type E3 ubiquitin transferase n=1 Tax=Purpureocillium takamizusanense TaxID=2060973 RepID=A0A9Q8QHK7_9HYPO|nr:RBR-type E3 ubiquitin transferase [Purpureocillium takamizusanense]UNI19019.1 RBR-type E3 ubiquitin transferase [Purpureocillium takamizusanense]